MSHILHLGNVSSLKGDSCGNPALQGRGRLYAVPSRLEDGTRLKDVNHEIQDMKFVTALHGQKLWITTLKARII